jgi:hypothetical protein
VLKELRYAGLIPSVALIVCDLCQGTRLRANKYNKTPRVAKQKITPELANSQPPDIAAEALGS